MATIAEFRIDPEEFPLGVVFDQYPDATVELERIIPTYDTVMPYFWVYGGDGTGIREVSTDESDVEITLVETVDGYSLFRAEWDPGSRRGVLFSLTKSAVSLLSGVGTRDGWTFEVRGDDHESVTAFLGRLGDEGTPIRLLGLHTLSPASIEGYGLTEPQREALLLAHGMGYYNSPREVTLEEVATELGISRQSLASRLRRGIRNLVDHTLSN